jgi:hypothetical protein
MYTYKGLEFIAIYIPPTSFDPIALLLCPKRRQRSKANGSKILSYTHTGTSINLKNKQIVCMSV